MPRRIDVELTSRREDGTWTWRAAGAREPRGSLDGGLLPAGSEVGHVLRVEVEIDVDGMVVTSVLPQKSARSEPNRLEIIGPARDENLVTTSLVRRAPGERRPRRDGDRPPRDRDDRNRDRPGRPGGGPGAGPGGRPRGDGPDRGGDRRGRPGFERRPPLEPKPKAKRLRPAHTHRRALIDELPELERPVAEELAQGGPAGVRAALDRQNEQAKAEGLPTIDPGPLMALADQLWPRMRTAEWRDRAEAALADVDELDLRDLRSVVVGADQAARDDATREMAASLRDALTRRVDEEHTKWLVELAELVAEGRVVAALRRSSRPPKAGALLPTDLSKALSDRTTEALNAEVSQERWAVLVDALAYSPVRTTVKPTSSPENPSAELVQAVRRTAARLPEIAAMFGITPEAPPAGGPGSRRGRPGSGRPGGGGPRPGGAPSGRPPAGVAGAGPEAGAGEATGGAPEATSSDPASAESSAGTATESSTASEAAAPSDADVPAAEAAPRADAAAPADAAGDAGPADAEAPAQPATSDAPEAAAEPVVSAGEATPEAGPVGAETEQADAADGEPADAAPDAGEDETNSSPDT
jgi:hypothetical protein